MYVRPKVERTRLLLSKKICDFSYSILNPYHLVYTSQNKPTTPRINNPAKIKRPASFSKSRSVKHEKKTIKLTLKHPVKIQKKNSIDAKIGNKSFASDSQMFVTKPSNYA